MWENLNFSACESVPADTQSSSRPKTKRVLRRQRPVGYMSIVRGGWKLLSKGAGISPRLLRGISGALHSHFPEAYNIIVQVWATSLMSPPNYVGTHVLLNCTSSSWGLRLGYTASPTGTPSALPRPLRRCRGSYSSSSTPASVQAGRGAQASYLLTDAL